MSKKLVVIGLITTALLLYFFYDEIYGFILRPYFELSVNPESVNLDTRTGSMNSTIFTIQSFNGYQGSLTVRVHLTGLVIIGNIYLTYPLEVYVEANEQASFSLVFCVSNISPGTYYADIIVSSGQIERSERIVIIAD
jgi:hypothetical protein